MKSSRKKLKTNKSVPEVAVPEIAEQKDVGQIKFNEYLGQTVTVYVNAGGNVGNGFTGVLLGYAGTYIKLLVKPSAAPSCSLGNACNGRVANPMFCVFCPYADTAFLGTMVEIPIGAVVAFVHNVLSHKHEI